MRFGLAAGILPAFALASGTANPARAASSEGQAWISNTAIANPSERDMIVMSVGQRFRPGTAGGDQQIGYILLEHDMSKAIQMGAMAYYRSDPEHELRLYQQFALGDGPLSSRTRLEERFLSSVDAVSWRLRQRIRYVRPLDRDQKWTLIGMGEWLFHFNRARPTDKTGLAVVRQFVGVNHAVTKQMDVQLMYMRQRTIRDEAPDTIAHIPWLTVRWHL